MLYSDFKAELATRGISENTLKFSAHESSDIVVPIMFNDNIEMCIVPLETRLENLHLTPQYQEIINNSISNLITSDSADDKPVLAESFFMESEWLYHSFPHLRVFINSDMVRFIETQRRIRHSYQSIKNVDNNNISLRTESVDKSNMVKQKSRRNKWRLWRTSRIFNCIGF
ncbi:hypothetical protein H4S04_008305 [Coemansia sp. S16]|nr:hypothetical protein H4S04_008305 [Coemansia sp. S16]